MRCSAAWALGVLAWGFAAPAMAAPSEALADRWVGSFRFAEAVPGTAFTHELFLTTGRDGQLVGTVVVDGRQTHLSMACRVLAAGESLTFVLSAHNDPPRPAGRYRPGDRLFTLTQAKGKLTTTWLKLKPQLPRQAWGSAGFVRQDHGRP